MIYFCLFLFIQHKKGLTNLHRVQRLVREMLCHPGHLTVLELVDRLKVGHVGDVGTLVGPEPRDAQHPAIDERVVDQLDPVDHVKKDIDKLTVVRRIAYPFRPLGVAVRIVQRPDR